MAHRAVPFWRVGDIIAIFLQMGCEIRTATITKVISESGEEVENVRFLFCPETNGFYPISDIEDDERIPPSEVETWERRLGLTIPKPPEG